MPNLNSITLADAQATPGSHVFTPTGPDLNGNLTLRDTTQEAGVLKYSITYKHGNTTDQGIRQEFVLKLPIPAETAAGSSTGLVAPPTVAFTPQAILTFVIPGRTTLQTRKDLAKMAYQLLNDAQVKASIENLVIYNT